METVKQLLEKAATGGYIVSTGQCSTMEIAFARAENRMYVDEDGLGYIWRPVGATLPTAEVCDARNDAQ